MEGSRNGCAARLGTTELPQKESTRQAGSERGMVRGIRVPAEQEQDRIVGAEGRLGWARDGFGQRGQHPYNAAAS